MKILKVVASAKYLTTPQYIAALLYKTTTFAKLPEFHQKALLVYMIEGAWEDVYYAAGDGSKIDKWLPVAIKLHGGYKIGYGTMKVDTAFKYAYLWPWMKQRGEKLPTTDAEVEVAYKRYTSGEGGSNIRKYKDPWPVILSDASYSKYDGILQDGWHRLATYWQRRGEKNIAFLRYL